MPLPHRGVLCLLLALVCAPRPAWAQPAPASQPDAATLAARSEFSLGVARARKGDWAAAYSHFLAAWKLKRHQQIALNLAHAELEVGKFKDAAEHFRFVLDDTDSSPADRKDATAGLAEAQRKLAHVQVDGDPAGARVFVDGVLVGKIPLGKPVPVDPGAHKVELRFGDARTEGQLTVASGETGSVSLRVPSGGPEPTPSTSGGPASPTSTPPNSERSTTLMRAVVLVGGSGLTLAGLAVGIGAAEAASGRAATVQRLCPTLPCSSAGAQDIENQWATLSNVSAWGFIGAGLAAAGTVTLALVLPRRGNRNTAVRFSPWGAGIAAEASW